ncbi:PCMD domain-containing protein [Sediminicola luteus]|uniref:Putative carbohydrate metabolism domain-containing protein n=1 Tax=Sediminicola luteus TaxID=319238 RepID=A0A2A4G5W5_9FLAO|nr:PCMD domain-containing protein [Sediminicola luteus]PCE63378.1 hypothetical protein B7P33_14260 [Sediminicola luteus]
MKNIVVSVLSVAFLWSCVSEDHFGKSGKALIQTFELEGQVGTTVIDNEALTIAVSVTDQQIDLNLAPTVIAVSNFAQVAPKVNEVQDFSMPVSYTVTAENGVTNTYTVTVERSGPDAQLDNTSFEDWYTATSLGKSFEQPGSSKTTTIWDTANAGLVLGGADPNTKPVEKTADSLGVQMVTVAAPALVRLAAATIFTGKFTEDFPSVSDPRSNIELGTPFQGRPLSFSFEYTYIPGAENADTDGQPLPYGDQCDIYLLLENREGSQTLRVGTAWFRSGESVSDWKKELVPVKYGELPASDPWYAYAQPQSGESWGTGEEPITHISVLATSSFEGDFFKGAIGSELRLDNIYLGY